MRVGATVATAVLGALLILGSAMPVLVRAGDVLRSGACNGPSDRKLQLSEDNGRVEVQYEVDQNVVGDVWRVRIRHDGDLVFAARRMTKAPSGSFEVRLLQRNRVGDDVFLGRALNLRTGEICRGRAVWTA